jgi:indolepyruvate ferredoxin oxidoreductase beta subunit
MSKGNILFCGVGGQGIILASEITAMALISSGLDVKKSEIHGMAQRGGAVVAHMRYGDKVYSPIVELGSADIEVAFELLESIRYLPYLNEKSRVIVNTQKILPLSVATGMEEYPPDVIGELKRFVPSVYPVDAFELARSSGEVRSVNMVLVGALSMFLPVEEELFIMAIKKRIPERFIDVNLKAFKKGREWINNIQEVGHK